MRGSLYISKGSFHTSVVTFLPISVQEGKRVIEIDYQIAADVPADPFCEIGGRIDA